MDEKAVKEISEVGYIKRLLIKLNDCVKMEESICMQRLIFAREQLPICGLLIKLKNWQIECMIWKKQNQFVCIFSSSTFDLELFR